MYKIKYNGSWKDTNNNINKVEIYIDSDEIIENEEIKIVDFKINNEIDLFSEDSFLKSGASFSIVSESPLYFLDKLYTANPLLFRVIHKINNQINFVGYLNTEVYNDNFFKRKNYKIDLRVNNSVKVLERLKFDLSNLNKTYNSAFDIIVKALKQNKIDFNFINIGLSTTIPNYTLTTTENILQKIKVNIDNYIDEKGNVMNCKEVIDSILTPFTAKIFFHKNEVYIIDINNLSKEIKQFKRYNYNSLSHSTNYTYNDVVNLDKFIESHSVTYTKAYNKVSVKLNKYVYDVIKYDFSKLVDKNTFLKTETRNGYKLDYYSGCVDNTIILNSDTYFVISEEIGNEENTEIYIQAKPKSTDLSTAYTNVSFWFNTNHTIISSKKFIKLGAGIGWEKLDKYGDEYLISKPFLTCYGVCKCGNKILDSHKWIDDIPANYQQWGIRAMGFQSNEGLNTSVNKFHYDSRNTAFLPLNSDFNEFNETIEGDKLIVGFSFPVESDTSLLFKIKDLELSYYKTEDYYKYKEVEKNDIEVQGYSNTDFEDDFKIEIKHGTDEDNNSRAALVLKKSGLYFDSDFATNERLVYLDKLIRNNKTLEIEELLLNTYLSNLENNNYLLSCNLLDYYHPLSLFKYEKLKRNNIEVNLFSINSTVDYVNNITSLELREIKEDN